MMKKTHDTNEVVQSRLELAQSVLLAESDALQRAAARLNGTFLQAVEAILACTGHVIVSGIGKSGHVGCKIAATLASTGTPAFFVHPAEAAHGDLGMITANDLVIAISNSGESQEIVSLLPVLKRKGVPIVAITGREHSTLQEEATIHIDASIEKEACLLGLAPTSSTTVQMALGDALAVTLMEARGFGQDDFALSHPGGSLGRQLLVRVEDLMHTGNQLPCVRAGTLLKDALLELSIKRLGMVAVCDDQQTVLGVYTDGDLRRTLERSANVYDLVIDQVMAHRPCTIKPQKLAAEALYLMETNKITALLVVNDKNQLIGALHLHDLLKAKII